MTDMPEARGPAPLRKLSLALADIKLAHSVFALPFAILAAVLVAPVPEFSIAIVEDATWPAPDPAPERPVAWGVFGVMVVLILACMVSARTWAMLVNRVADRGFDADNPRTARRAFARGDLTGRDGMWLLGGSAGAFVACCALFGVLFANWWPALLSLPVLAWIALYSFTKRFTWLCHLFLGGALAASPLAAAIAVDGWFESLWPWFHEGTRIDLSREPAVSTIHFTEPGVAIPWLAAMVLFWVAGFDVIYALQDLDFDRGAGLKSVPARFGWRGAVWIARALHALALASLGVAWWIEPRFGVVFGVGFGVVALTLVLEHTVLARRGHAGIPMAFFTLNGVVSLALGGAGVLDALL